MSDFFEKRAKSAQGRFFQDMPGRESGNFFKASSAGMKPSTSEAAKPAPANIGQTGAPVGSPDSASGMSGGIYGTGDGAKVAAADPSDWEGSEGIPSGLHRPSSSTPEALESGGERFFSSDSGLRGGAGLPRHGLLETGGVAMGPNETHQIGKHASDLRFLGTSLAKTAAVSDYTNKVQDYGQQLGNKIGPKAEDKWGRFKTSLGKGVSQAGDAAEKGVNSIVDSPAASGVAALLAGGLALRGLGGVGRGVGRMLGRGRKPPAGLFRRVADAVRNK